MKIKFQKAVASVLLSSLILTNTAFAASSVVNKSETVYVIQKDGKIDSQIVSVWLNSEDQIKGEDKTDLLKIKNLKTDEKINPENGYIKWDENKKDVYYQGKSDKELPIDIKVKYFLDGKEIDPKDLEGKSGHLKISIETENKRYTTKKINGQNTKIYSPFTVLSAMSFNTEVTSNIEAPDSKIEKDGKNEVVTTVLTPGLRDNFESVLEDRQMEDFRNDATIEMEVENYEPVEVYVVISNELFQNEVDIESIDKLRDGVRELEDNSQKLVDASVKLSDAQGELNNGIGDLNSGAEKLHDGSKELYDKSGELEDKFDEVIEKVEPVPGYVAEMDDGGTKLSSGLNEYTGAVGKLNDNTGKMVDGAHKLAKGSADLDDGLGKLKDATSKLRDGSSKLNEVGDLKEKALKKLMELKNGINQLSAGAKELETGAGDAVKGSAELASGMNDFNTNMKNLNDQVQGITLPDLSELQGIDVSSNLQAIGGSAQAIGNNLGDIQNAIRILSKIKVTTIGPDGNEITQTPPEVNDVIELLTRAAGNIGTNSKTIGRATTEVGTQLKALQGLNGTLDGMGGKINELKTGTKGLTEASDNLNKGAQKLSKNLPALQEGAGKLSSEIDQVNSGLEDGMQKITNEMDVSQLIKLSDALVKLDDATGQLKDGSSKLRAGTEESEDGVNKLASAISELDSNSGKLNDGANDLSSGLHEFREKSEMFKDFPRLKTEGLSPMRDGIKKLNDGIVDLNDGTVKLQDGGDVIDDAMKKFADKLEEFKQKGIDELDNKTKELPEFKEIVDTMSDLAKEDSSFTGTSEGFDTKYRIIEKIK